MSPPRGTCSVWTVGSGGSVIRGEIRQVLSIREQFLSKNSKKGWRRILLFGDFCLVWSYALITLYTRVAGLRSTHVEI